MYKVAGRRAGGRPLEHTRTHARAHAHNLLSSGLLGCERLGFSRDGIEAEMADEARQLVKKATKLLTPSFMAMRMKADWDQATPLFEEAARLFARSGQQQDAQYCFEKASEGQKKLGSELHAVKHLESAAECAVKDKRHEDAFNLYRTSYEMFAGIGKIALGAKTLAKGAQLLSDEGKIDFVEQVRQNSLRKHSRHTIEKRLSPSLSCTI